MCVHIVRTYSFSCVCCVLSLVVEWKICTCLHVCSLQPTYNVPHTNSPQAYMLGQVPAEGDTQGNEADLQVRRAHSV